MKKSKLVLATGVLTSLYFGLMVLTILDSVGLIQNSANIDPNLIGVGLGLALAMMAPHLILTFLGMVFSWVAYGTSKAGFLMAGAILMSVSALFWWSTMMLTLILGAFAFVAYAGMIKQNKQASQ